MTTIDLTYNNPRIATKYCLDTRKAEVIAEELLRELTPSTMSIEILGFELDLREEKQSLKATYRLTSTVKETK